jgi:uncharacterized protein YndB with AHSA1/START domain
MKEVAPAAEPIVVECDLPDAPEKVWRALTEQELLAQWVMPNDLHPEVGARFQFRPAEKEAAPIDCEILEAQPNRTLRWRQTERGDAASGWLSIDSVVSVELTRRSDGGTHLRLIHDRFEIVASELDQRFRTPRACATVIPFRIRGSVRRCQPESLVPIVCQFRAA